MIEYAKGDIFYGGDDVIVHGCNCWVTFGAGIAKQVRKYYPLVYEIDQRTKCGDKAKLGTYTSIKTKNVHIPGKNVIIVNAYTQWGHDPETKPFDYEAFATVLPKIKEDFKGLSIAMPKIGAGLAGGDWNRIEKMINDVFGETKVKVYVL